MIIITGRNEVVAKVMFLQVCVCPQGGGCLPQCMLGCHTPPPREADSSIRSTSGQYASYWNAFLLKRRFSNKHVIAPLFRYIVGCKLVIQPQVKCIDCGQFLILVSIRHSLSHLKFADCYKITLIVFQ